MTKLVLLRHGESIWNKENLFTGWTDVDLSDQGMAEAKRAGGLLKAESFTFDIAYHICSQAGNSHTVGCAGRTGLDVDPCRTLMAVKRAALWGTARPEQGTDSGEVRRRASFDLAAQL